MLRVPSWKCPECGRIFDVNNERDADEWTNGHDCEEPVRSMTDLINEALNEPMHDYDDEGNVIPYKGELS